MGSGHGTLAVRLRPWGCPHSYAGVCRMAGAASYPEAGET